MRRSTDNRQTWSDPVRLPGTGYGGPVPNRAIQHSSGRILLPCRVSLDKLVSTHAYCFYSDDQGKSWNKSPLITTPKGSTGRRTGPATEEPAIVELKDGRLMMFLRCYLKSMYVSYSSDRGATWSQPTSSGIPSPGSMPLVKRLPDGNILLIWNYAPLEKNAGPFPRTQITSAVSTDDGKNFSSIRLLDGSTDFTGPHNAPKITMATVEFSEDRATIVYSKSMMRKNAYDWRLQVVPISWFYEGDTQQVYGQKNLPTLHNKLAAISSASATTSAAAPVKLAPVSTPTPQQRQPNPRRVNQTRQLFIDDDLIASIDGLERIVNQPARHQANPVLTWEKPWEGNYTIAWGSVLYEPEAQQFKMWYQVYRKFPKNPDRASLLCYATSTDGVSWHKPEFGLFAYRGSKANNIVFQGDGEELDTCTIFPEPHPADDVKYRMYWFDSGRNGVRTATSADGIHWNPVEGIRVQAGDRTTAGYDPVRKKYFVITRIPGRGLRTCGLWESDDGMDFEHVGEILAPDTEDPPRTSFYGMVSFPYAGMRLGFLEFFFDRPIRKLNTQLVYSHDGIQWHRGCDRQVFMNWGPPGSWDQAWVFPTQNYPIRIDDKLYIFYQARSTLHYGERPYGHIGSIGLAFLRVDGFASLDSVRTPGTVTTSPLLLEGNTLRVNANARPGTVAAEVLDLAGQPITGFTVDDCQAISNQDSIAGTLRWRENRSLSELAGATVRLRFHVQGAKLYSFWLD